MVPRTLLVSSTLYSPLVVVVTRWTLALKTMFHLQGQSGEDGEDGVEGQSWFGIGLLEGDWVMTLLEFGFEFPRRGALDRMLRRG